LGSTSATRGLTVNKAGTGVVLTSSVASPVFGQSVTFTAAVSAAAPGSGTPTGTVTFKDGTATLGTGTLSGGTATFTTSKLSVRLHNLTATYGGDPNFLGGTFGGTATTVAQDSTTVGAITSSANPAAVN